MSINDLVIKPLKYIKHIIKIELACGLFSLVFIIKDTNTNTNTLIWLFFIVDSSPLANEREEEKRKCQDERREKEKDLQFIARYVSKPAYYISHVCFSINIRTITNEELFPVLYFKLEKGCK